jgi:group I intron endonuclease
MEYIYKITNLKNGKFYIGKTSDIERRWKEHLSLAGKKRHPFYDAIAHYGAENFIIEVVDKTDVSLINDLEKKWILETNAIKLGYNITEGGTGGDTFSNKSDKLKKITREKLRNHILENNPMSNEMIKEKHNILVNANEYKQNMSNIVKSRNSEYKKRLSDGIKLALQSPELRKKWSECKTGNQNGRALGCVIITDLNGNQTKYETAKEAAKNLVITAHLIREHCRNNTTFKRGLYKGWKFEFENEVK